MSTTLGLVSELERVTRELDSATAGAAQPSLPAITEKLAKIIGVRNEEVAHPGGVHEMETLALSCSPSAQKCRLHPAIEHFRLAATTVRASRPQIDNNFGAARHAIVFENIKLCGERQELIQKIISAPILHDGKVIGVIQVSREGWPFASRRRNSCSAPPGNSAPRASVKPRSQFRKPCVCGHRNKLTLENLLVTFAWP